MTYFDTDVLVHFFYNQDETKHIDSIKLIEKCMTENSFAVSWLNIQETGLYYQNSNNPISLLLKS